MSNIIPKNEWVLLRKYNKTPKKDDDSPFKTPMAVSNTNLGEVLFTSPVAGLEVGTKVYFVGSVEKLMLEDATEVLAVKAENIVAVIEGP